MVSHYVHARHGWLIPVALLSLAAGSALLVRPLASRLLGVWTAAVLVFAVGDVQDGPSLIAGSLIGLIERLALWSYVAWLALAAVTLSTPAGRTSEMAGQSGSGR